MIRLRVNAGLALAAGLAVACGGRVYGPADPAPDNPACARAAPERMRIQAMLAAGKLDHALRIMQRIEGTCPEQGELTWADHVTALAAIGRTPEARQLANRIDGSSRATDVDRAAAAAARVAITEYERHANEPEAARERSRAELHEALDAAARGDAKVAKEKALASWATSHPNARALVEAGLAAHKLGEYAVAQRLWDRAVFDDQNAPIRPQVGARPPFDARGNAVAISSNGKRIAAGGGSIVDVYDENLGALLLLSVGDDLVTSVAMTPDARELFVGLVSGRVRAFDLVTAEPSRELPTEASGAVSALAVSDDGKRLAIGAQDGAITLVDLTSGGAGPVARVRAPSLAVRRTKELKLTLGPTGGPVRFAWSADGAWLAWADDLGGIGLVDAKGGKPASLPAPGGVVVGLGFGGPRVLDAFTPDKHVRYDLAHRASPAEVEHDVHVRAAATAGAAVGVVQSGRVRLFASSDQPIGRGVVEAEGVDDTVRMAITPDAKSAAMFGKSSLRVLRPDGTLVELAKPAALESVTAAADGSVIAVGAADGGVHIVPLPSRSAAEQGDQAGPIVVARAPGLGARVALSPDGGTLAAGAASGGVTLLDRKGAAQGRVEMEGPVLSLAFSPDGARLAVGGRASHVHLADAHTGAAQRDLDLDAGDVIALAFSPGGGKLLSSCSSGLTLWDVAAARGERYTGFGAAPHAIAWAPENAAAWQKAGAERPAFAVARSDASIAMGAPGKPSPLSLTHLLGAAVDVAYASGALVVAEQDGSLTLRTPEGKILERLRVPGAAARKIAALPNGIAAAMSDGALRIFLPQKKGREVVALWPVAKGAVAASPDGHIELLGEARHTVVCRLGPIAYPWEVCAEPFKVVGLVAVAISGKDPGEADL